LRPYGSFVLPPNIGTFGAVSFTYRASDVNLTSNPITVSSSITAVNDAPVAAGQAVTTREETPLGVTLTGADADGDMLTYTATTLPAHGTLQAAPPGLIYTPDANYSGPDGFGFTAHDGLVASAPPR
jgi:hypothetical protein